VTILVAIRTGSAAVIAADSRITTVGFSGTGPDGNPLYLPQTYDHAVKVVHDLSETTVAAFAGFGNIGEQSASDYFSRLSVFLSRPGAEQDDAVESLMTDMVEHRQRFFTKIGISPDARQSTRCLLLGSPTDRTAPRVWRISLEGEGASRMEILQTPNIWLEGSYDAAFPLLFGHSGSYFEAVRQKLGLDQPCFDDVMAHAIEKTSPIKRINFLTMPIQDAIDLAVFIAQVQIEMERFLPGVPACCGPVDVMTMELAPKPRIRSFPGKALHHPATSPNGRA